jgi:hypothetical protein
MTMLYEPYIPTRELEGKLTIEIKEETGPGVYQPSRVIKTTSNWSIDVSLLVEGNLATDLPPEGDDNVWEFKAFVENMTGLGPEGPIGEVKRLLVADGAAGVNGDGYDTREWKTTISIPAGNVDLNGGQYAVCQLTFVAITLDKNGIPIRRAHFATVDDHVAIYQPR